MGDEYRLPDDRDGGFTVYGLTDPDTGAIRYVGVSGNLKERYAQHRRGSRSLRTNPALREWLATLDANGRVPGITILIRITGPLSFMVAKGRIEKVAIEYCAKRHRDGLLQTVPQPAVTGSTRKRITFRGRTRTLVQWAKELGITRQALHQRLQRHSVTKALSTSKNGNGKT